MKNMGPADAGPISPYNEQHKINRIYDNPWICGIIPMQCIITYRTKIYTILILVSIASFLKSVEEE